MANAHTTPKTRAALIALAVAGLLLCGGLLLSASRLGARSFHGTAWEPSQTAAEFRLTDHTGRSVSMSDFRGKGVLVFFGYTRCPDVCPLTLVKLHRVLSGMGRNAEDVRVLLVTVDPERDTPEALADYVARFRPWIVGLTGSEESLAEVRKSYYAYAEPATPPTYPGVEGHAGHPAPTGALSHTPQVIGIDRQGEIRVLLPMDRTDEEIADDIRTLLRI